MLVFDTEVVLSFELFSFSGLVSESFKAVFSSVVPGSIEVACFTPQPVIKPASIMVQT